MALFDGSRRDRLRRSRYGGSRVRGPFTAHAEANVYAFPWPSMGVYLEDETVSVGFRVGDALNDPAVAVSLTVRLPRRATGFLHRWFPYEDEWTGR